MSTALERAVLEEVSLDSAWELVEEFSTLVRDAGSADERRALESIIDRLDAWKVDYELHEPEALIGIPGAASLELRGERIVAKAASMALATPPQGLTATVVYEASPPAVSVADLLAEPDQQADVRGRIVAIDGFPLSSRVASLSARGAVGVIAIAPGQRIHEMICTPIWGSPDLLSSPQRPQLPVVSIAQMDGDRLVRMVGDGAVEVTLFAEQDTGWRRIPVLVAEVSGQVDPESFVLVHGHLDSWHVGVGDNATGDATLLELARVLGRQRGMLDRSVRIAWWSGHSQGRYAGSTWYADEFALDIERNCICHINCDSPGCRDADVFEDVCWMTEAEDFAKQAIRDFAGQESTGTKPLRGGDASFNNLGVSTFFMLSSTMDAELRERRGYYTVAGCGGNIEWHTEADTLAIADRDNLLRDIRLYAGSTVRAANSVLLPLDYRATARQLEQILGEYGAKLGDRYDFDRSLLLLERLQARMEELYADAVRTSPRAARDTNEILLAVGRELVRLLYASAGPYRQDPARSGPLLPDLNAAVEAIGKVPEGVLTTELTRVRNRIDAALIRAIERIERRG